MGGGIRACVRVYEMARRQSRESGDKTKDKGRMSKVGRSRESSGMRGRKQESQVVGRMRSTSASGASP